MSRTVEAVIDEQGNVRLLEPVHLPSSRRALVTILEDQQPTGTSDTAHRDSAHCGTGASAGHRPQQPIAVPETTLLSQTTLAEDWNRPEEDEAWRHLQKVS